MSLSSLRAHLEAEHQQVLVERLSDTEVLRRHRLDHHHDHTNQKG